MHEIHGLQNKQVCRTQSSHSRGRRWQGWFSQPGWFLIGLTPVHYNSWCCNNLLISWVEELMWADWCLTHSRVSTIWYKNTEDNIQKFWWFHHCSCVWYQVMYKLLNTDSDFTFSPTSLPRHSAAAPNLEVFTTDPLLQQELKGRGTPSSFFHQFSPRRNWVLNFCYNQQPFIPLVMEHKKKYNFFNSFQPNWTQRSLLSVHFNFRETQGTASLNWDLPMRRHSTFSLITTKR